MKYSLIRKVVLALIIATGIVVVLFVSREIAIRFFDYKPPAISESQLTNAKRVDVVLEQDEPYQHIVTDQYIYFVHVDKIFIANANGRQTAEYEIVTSEPVVRHSGKYVVIGDIGGHNAYILENDKLKNTIQTSGAIVDATVNSSGYSVLVTQGDMHKRDVTVYDSRGEEQFVWNSGSLFVLNAVAADNNKNVIISTLDTSGGKMKSILTFYNMSDPESIATEEYEGELLASLEVKGSYVFCVGDSKTCVYRVSGEKHAEIPYNGKTLITYQMDHTNIAMAFCESMLNGKRYDIETYHASGKQIGTYELDYKINYIDYAEDAIAISRGRLINVVDTHGREKNLIDPGIDLSNLNFLGGASKAVGFTAKGAYIFNIS